MQSLAGDQAKKPVSVQHDPRVSARPMNAVMALSSCSSIRRWNEQQGSFLAKMRLASNSLLG